jgi:hypothetical protein
MQLESGARGGRRRLDKFRLGISTPAARVSVIERHYSPRDGGKTHVGPFLSQRGAIAAAWLSMRLPASQLPL